MGLAAANMDASAAAVLSGLDGIFGLEQEPRTALKAFLSGRDVFVFTQTGFGKSLVKHRLAARW